MYKYFNELLLGESIESAYVMLNSEQHRLTPRYDIMRSLVPFVKHYFVTMKEDDTLFKFTCKIFNSLQHVKVGVENYSILPVYMLDFLLLYYILKILILKISTFSDMLETNSTHVSESF